MKQTILILSMLLWISGARGLEMEWVTVGDEGNAADDRYISRPECGAVAYTYDIGKYEVTNAQYCEFLNAVAADDPNGLYILAMGNGAKDDIGGITRTGSQGGYTYAIRPSRRNRPVSFVNWYDTLRFANWMHNGQPIGPQDASTTEDGAYFMPPVPIGPHQPVEVTICTDGGPNGGLHTVLVPSANAGRRPGEPWVTDIPRKPGARVFIPSVDEWHKAAYYKGGGTDAGYWDYPTQSNTAPTGQAPPGKNMTRGSANCQDRTVVVHADLHNPIYVEPAFFTTEVGAYTAKPSTSAYGTFDQGGNLWEWTETTQYRGLHVARGGSFDGPYDLLHAAGYSHAGGGGHDNGFRVAKDPQFECYHGGDHDGHVNVAD